MYIVYSIRSFGCSGSCLLATPRAHLTKSAGCPGTEDWLSPHLPILADMGASISTLGWAMFLAAVAMAIRKLPLESLRNPIRATSPLEGAAAAPWPLLSASTPDASHQSRLASRLPGATQLSRDPCHGDLWGLRSYSGLHTPPPQPQTLAPRCLLATWRGIALLLLREKKLQFKK